MTTTEAERQELLAIIREYEYPNDTTPYGKVFAWAKSQLSRLPEAAEVEEIRARAAEDDALQVWRYVGPASSCANAFKDRATLLTLVDAQARALSVREAEVVRLKAEDALMRDGSKD